MSIVKVILCFFVGIFLSICVYIMAMIVLGTFFSILGYIYPNVTTLSTLFYVALLVIVIIYITSVIRRLKKQQRYSALSGFITGMIFLTALTVYLFIRMVVIGS